MPSKQTLLLVGLGVAAGYFLANSSLINVDFNGSGSSGVGLNPFAKAYEFGLNSGGIKTS